ncbi:MAG: TraB/GumN family protein [Pseudomonadota bacterium]
MTNPILRHRKKALLSAATAFSLWAGASAVSAAWATPEQEPVGEDGAATDVIVDDPTIETSAESIIGDASAFDGLPLNDAVNDLQPSAPVPETGDAPRADAPGRATPAMWRIADADSEIWLLGTFHILPPGLDWRSDSLARAIDAAETLYFEAEVDTPEARSQTVNTLMTQGFLPPGETLTGKLGGDYGEKLRAAAAEVGLPFDAIDTMRPWQAFLAMTVQYIVAKGFDPGSGVETVLLQEARLRGRDLRFFETVDQQLSLFTGLKPETELALLRFTLDEWPNQEAQLNALLQAWRDGDIAAIDEMLNEGMRQQSPEVYDALIVRRNQAWAAQINDVLNGSGKALVAVGAAHLVGDDSVPALLRAQGVTVDRYGVE